MKDRDIICEYYEYHNKCKKNKPADIYKFCQHCGLYQKKMNEKPFRVNKKKREKYKGGIDYE